MYCNCVMHYVFCEIRNYYLRDSAGLTDLQCFGDSIRTRWCCMLYVRMIGGLKDHLKAFVPLI